MKESLVGKTYAITGASSGLGFETARQLIERGASVLALCRQPVDLGPNAEHIYLDLSDVSSIDRCLEMLQARPLDGLLNNAGVLNPNEKLVHGCEAHMGVNFLAHFALTAGLYVQLTPAARVVHVSSMAAQFVQLGGLSGTKLSAARSFKAYARSKLANLMFALELAERSEVVSSIAVHPGYTATNLQSNLALGPFGNWLLGQSLAQGAMPLVDALTNSELPSGSFYGPTRFFQLRGAPTQLTPYKRATEPDQRASLWAFAEQMMNRKFIP
ncbi:MAG: SDR family NAD(P)-dependent oxidoreductase [Pseudomonadales bacterium]|nr:SDR family NAD(P)-dependent oxidoreductase [Pseudomonadales bacterium]